MAMNDEQTFTLSIAAKDWRTRRWLVTALAAVALTVFGFWAWWTSEKIGRIDDPESALFTLSAGYVLACVVLGAALWSGEEHDPARAFIHTLPFSRARLLWLKLAALWPAFALLTILWLILWLAMLGMLSLIDIKIGRHPESFLLADFGKRALTPGIIISYVAITLVLGVFGAIVGAAAQLHFRTAILSTLVGIVTAALLNGMVLLDAFIRVGAAHEELDAAILAPTLARALVALGLMGGWLFFVFCRTALREQGPTARSLLGLLWIVGAAEVFAVAFFTNWRDLVFILFGA